MNKNILFFGLLALGAVLLIQQMNRPRIPYVPPTGNVQRDDTVTKILQYLTLAGVASTTIMSIINNIKGMSDSQVQQLYDNVRTSPSNYA